MIRYAIAGVLLAIGGVSTAIPDYHMLQQNSYYASRYAKWLSGARSRYLVHLFFAAILLTCCRWATPFVAAAAVFALVQVLRARSWQKRAIKPLVFTARVCRLLATNALLILGFSVVSVLWCRPLRIVAVVLATATPLTVLAVKAINEPIEAAVRRYYYNDARRILLRHKPMTVIGITGSYGKTSTKYALAALLQEKYNVCFTPGSFNTTLGVVRTIRERLKTTDDVFIVEMGAKQVGDIREICDLVQPDFGIITSVGEQHLETFKTLENVCRTKFELADAVKRKGGKMYLNMDCPPVAERAAEYDFVGYGHENGEVCVVEGASGRFGSSFTVTRGETALSLQTKLLGSHNIQNITGAVALAMDLGVSERDLRFAVSKLAPVSHRLEMKPFQKGSLLLDDAYNANPAGCLEAVRVLSTFDGCRKILVTPGLVELGEREEACNADLGRAAMDVCDVLVFVGKERSKPLMAGAETSERFNREKIFVVSSFQEAMSILSPLLQADCVVLLENDLPDNYSK